MKDRNERQWQGDELLADGLEQARRLVESLEAGCVDEAGHILNRLCRMRENSLYRDIGRLARDLHRSLSGFHDHVRLHAQMANDMPDVRERLDGVIKATEKSAHQTLAAIESCGPVVDGLAHLAAELRIRWSGLGKNAGLDDSVHAVVAETETFLNAVAHDTQQMREHMKNVLLAQEYQDLTGQDIQRVIRTVLAVESSLLDMLRTSDGSRDGESGNAEVGRVEDNKAGQLGGAELDQDDVDDLLGSLGF